MQVIKTFFFFLIFKIGATIAENNPPSDQTEQLRKKKKKKPTLPSSIPRAKGSQSANLLSPFSPVGRLTYGFVSCPLCSFFISGYRNSFGAAALTTLAEENAEKEWLEFDWSEPLARIVSNSYDFYPPQGVESAEGSCSECRRAYFYEQGSAETPPTFHIQIIPQLRN